MEPEVFPGRPVAPNSVAQFPTVNGNGPCPSPSSRDRVSIKDARNSPHMSFDAKRQDVEELGAKGDSSEGEHSRNAHPTLPSSFQAGEKSSPSKSSSASPSSTPKKGPLGTEYQHDGVRRHVGVQCKRMRNAFPGTQYGKYYRVERDPNGGADLLHIDHADTEHLTADSISAVAKEFLKVRICIRV